MNSALDKTYIAIDYGSRRIGIAKSDPTGLIASPLTTLEVKSLKQAVEEVVTLIEKYNPKAVVIGYPLLKSGDKSEKCGEVDRFIEVVGLRSEVEFIRVDESHTSQEAADIVHAHGKKAGKDKKRIDRLAATLILERFLETQQT